MRRSLRAAPRRPPLPRATAPPGCLLTSAYFPSSSSLTQIEDLQARQQPGRRPHVDEPRRRREQELKCSLLTTLGEQRKSCALHDALVRRLPSRLRWLLPGITHWFLFTLVLPEREHEVWLTFEPGLCVN